MTYRLLEVDTEWPLVEPAFTARNLPMPSPHMAMIMGAFDNTNQLQGFLVCQLQFHFEPLVLNDPRAFRGIVHAMEAEVAAKCPGAAYFAFAPDAKMSGLCTAVGMDMMPVNTFAKILPGLPGSDSPPTSPIHLQ